MSDLSLFLKGNSPSVSKRFKRLNMWDAPRLRGVTPVFIPSGIEYVRFLIEVVRTVYLSEARNYMASTLKIEVKRLL